jgi:hypothetical protein
LKIALPENYNLIPPCGPTQAKFLLAGLSTRKNIYRGYTNEKSRPVFPYSLFQTNPPPSQQALVKANPTPSTTHILYIHIYITLLLLSLFLTNYHKYSTPNPFLYTHATNITPASL